MVSEAGAFSVGGELVYPFPRELQAIKRFVTPYVLRSIAVSSQPGWFEEVAKVRGHVAREVVGINICQGTPWSKELDGKKLHGAAWW